MRISLEANTIKSDELTRLAILLGETYKASKDDSNSFCGGVDDGSWFSLTSLG
jgi:hypothetical protein